MRELTVRFILVNWNRNRIVLFAEALPGDNVGFSVEDISARELQRGFVCSDANNDPAQEAASFIAQASFFSSSDLLSFCFDRSLYLIILVESVKVIHLFLIVIWLI